MRIAHLSKIVCVGSDYQRAGRVVLPAGRAKHGHRNVAQRNRKQRQDTCYDFVRRGPQGVSRRTRLSEKLRITDSIAHFDKAISLDPTFAWAGFSARMPRPRQEFFEHLKKAVALADKASDGERMLIQANEAGANGDPTKQKEILEKLVAAYPNDERAHFNLGGYYFGQQDFTQAIALQTLD